jgi:hypothetical protein
MAASLLVFLLVSEFVIFRFIFLPSDMPENRFIENVIRYRPNQSGIYRKKDDIIAEYRINSQGWNSKHTEYSMKRNPGKMRVAIIGDSYVEALQVPYTESMAEQLERLLGSDKAEVFRFGIGGAPLSQYLYMFEREVIRFSPDLVVILMVHNDFDESFRFRQGRYTSSFMKLQLRNSAVVGELQPYPYKQDWKDRIRATALARYFYYRQDVRGNMLPFFRKQSIPYEANIDVAAVQNVQGDIEVVTDYSFGRIKAVATANNTHLLLLMDGVRSDIYNESSSNASVLNGIAQKTSERHTIPFMDLHDYLMADWKEHKMRFEFLSDNHWNEHGHQIAAKAIKDYIDSQTR